MSSFVTARGLDDQTHELSKRDPRGRQILLRDWPVGQMRIRTGKKLVYRKQCLSSANQVAETNRYLGLVEYCRPNEGPRARGAYLSKTWNISTKK